MPRRKQDCPKRMKWDESHGECHKNDDEVNDATLPRRSSSRQASSINDDDDNDEGDSRKDEYDEVGTVAGLNIEGAKTDEEKVIPGDETDGIKDNGDISDQTNHLVKIAENELDVVHDCKEPHLFIDKFSSFSPLPKIAKSSTMELTVPLSPQLGNNRNCENHIEMLEKDTFSYENRDTPNADSSPVEKCEQDGPLDFSLKRSLNSSSSVSSQKESEKLVVSNNCRVNDSPLDLSVPRKHSSIGNSHGEVHSSHKCHRLKIAKVDKASSPWNVQFPFSFSPTTSPNSSVEVPLWNGSVKGSRVVPVSSPSSAHQHHHHHQHHYTQSTISYKQVEPSTNTDHPNRTVSPVASSTISPSKSTYTTSSSSNRHNAWQSQWLSRGAEQARDVLKCVWCRKSFSSLEEMTNHMKETKHCGVQQLHQQLSLPNAGMSGSGSSRQNHCGAQGTASNTSSKPTSNEESTLSSAKETMPMPRKLVRGQDVWLGKGAEQTKQILKCMWCGQSFKSLAEMTTHMQQTQHYTNIISQEQIISWKSPEEKGCNTHSHVNAVLTCKVCDQAFSSLKELSNHMVKNSHYKEHILRSITENGGRRRQTREKRKKSLPVRKLLELERAQNEIRGKPTSSLSPSRSGSLQIGNNGRITCEKCGRKIDTQSFVDHIRLCVGESSNLKSASSTSSTSSETPIMESVSPVLSTNASFLTELPNSPSTKNIGCIRPDPSSPSSPERTVFAAASNGRLESGTPSVLNAIEKLIEKSFDKKRNRQVYVSSSTTTPSPSIPLSMQCGRKSMTFVNDDDISSSAGNKRHEHSKAGATSRKGSSLGIKRCFDMASEKERRRFSKKHYLEEANEKQTPQTIKEEMTDDSESEDTFDYHKVDSCSPAARISVDSVVTKASQLSPLDTKLLHPLSNASPLHVAESPGSCSDSSAGGGGGGQKGRLLSFVRSTPSPISPSHSDHPLKELQKLLDKTNVSNNKTSVSTPPTAVTSSSVISNVGTNSRPTSSPSALGSMLSFNCVCSDSNTLSGESIIKCTFCDTPFISKGTYRQHLSKVHAIKDNHVTSDAAFVTTSSCTSATTSFLATSVASTSTFTAPSTSISMVNCEDTPASTNKTSKADNASTADESPHSKFLKYTELAKQLSSKYV